MLARDDYPEKIFSKVVRFHLFGIESIDEQLDGSPRIIAHQVFNGDTIPCLSSSDLHYQPEVEKHRGEIITGIVRASLPDEWYRFTSPRILNELKKFVIEHYESKYSLQASINNQAIEVFDQDGSCIAIIEGERDSSSVILTVDVRLEKPENKNEYYESMKQSVELWGYLHDFVAHGGKTNDIPMRYIRGNPQHEIYIGGVRPAPTDIEMDLVSLLEDVHNLDSDLPTPKLGDIDFKEVDDSASLLGTDDVVAALKHVIAAKRIFYRHTKRDKPITTAELIYAMNRQQSLLQQSPDENSHRD